LAQDTKVLKETEINPMILETAEDALTRALEITGFEKLMKVDPFSLPADSLAKKVVVENDSTPFLSDLIIGRQLWQVSLDSVDIRPECARDRGYDMWRRKSFRIWLGPSGKLLKIYSIPHSQDSICTPILTSDEATDRLNRKGEMYLGFPEKLPMARFIHALNAASGCKPLVANEIIAQYVMYSEFGSSPMAVWCITSLGIPPTHFTSHRKKHVRRSTQDLDCERCLINAENGKWLSMISIPCSKPQIND
jgi:hypothetical protein